MCLFGVGVIGENRCFVRDLGHGRLRLSRTILCPNWLFIRRHGRSSIPSRMGRALMMSLRPSGILHAVSFHCLLLEFQDIVFA